MEREEEFSLVVNIDTSEPIYNVDGTVLVQRSSDKVYAYFSLEMFAIIDGYQFFTNPDALIMNNAENQSEAALGDDLVEFPSSQSSLSSPLSNNPPIEKHWSRNDILKLIHEYKKNKENFASSAVRNAKVWVQIANTLGSHDAKQCENKFKYLKSKYLKKKDNMSIKQSGAQRINFEYFEELDEIFKKQPIVVPVIASSSRENPIENIQVDEIEREESNSQNQEQEEQQPRSRNIRLRDALITLNNILKESEGNKEKRHRDLLHMQKESLDTFKTLMEKMLEKM